MYINGAEPGDALAVELLDLQTQGWAWTGVLPGLGLLKEAFNQPYIHHWDLHNGRTTEFRPGIIIPLDPFPSSTSSRTTGSASSSAGTITEPAPSGRSPTEDLAAGHSQFSRFLTPLREYFNS